MPSFRRIGGAKSKKLPEKGLESLVRDRIRVRLHRRSGSKRFEKDAGNRRSGGLSQALGMTLPKDNDGERIGYP